MVGLCQAAGCRCHPLKRVPNGEPWGRWHQSGHTSQGGTQSSHPTGRGCHPISWSLLQNLAPRGRGSQLRDSHIPTVWFRIATAATKPYSCSRLQQLEQVYHLRAQAIAQPGWQCLQASRHILNQGGPIRQGDLREINWEISLWSRPPRWGRGNDKEGAGSQDIHILVTQRGEPLERSPEGIDVPPCGLMALQFLGEGLPEGVLPGLHFDVFPSTTIKR